MSAPDLSALSAPFDPKDVSWRLQSAGKGDHGHVWALAVAYLDSRAIQERLDAVCGPAGWSVEYQRQEDGTVWAGLTIHGPHGPVTKWDGTGPIKESDGISASDAAKGTLSVAFKRSAVVWGIGRYLYHLPAAFATTHTDPHRGRFRGKTKDQTKFSWDPPALPAWALPGGSGQQPAPAVVDLETGEILDDDDTPTAPPPPPFRCPRCQGEVWDNRDNKPANRLNAPDLVCKDRRACGWRVWMDGWTKALRERASQVTPNTLTLQEAGLIEVGLASGEPHKLLAVHRKLDELLGKATS